MNTPPILIIGYFISIAVLVIAFLVSVKFYFPLLIKEGLVKNGLAKLRRQLLYLGILTITLSGVSIATLTLRFFVPRDSVGYLIVALLVIHSFGFLTIAIIQSRIYRQQYTDKHDD